MVAAPRACSRSASVEDDQRGVAAELKGDLLHVLAADRCAAHALADRSGAGEGDQAGDAVLDEVVADLGAGADHDVEHARGQAGGFEDGGQQEAARQRGVGGRFEHHGVAAPQGGGNRAHGEREGEVPRADDADHAERLAEDEVGLARGVRGQDLPGHAGGEGRGLPQGADGQTHLDVALDHRGAGLRADQLDHGGPVLLDRVGGPVEDLRAVPRRQRGQLDLRGFGSCVGGIDVIAGGLTDGHDRLVVEGIGVGGGALGGALAPAADVELLGDEGGVRGGVVSHDCILPARATVKGPRRRLPGRPGTWLGIGADFSHSERRCWLPPLFTRRGVRGVVPGGWR